MSQGVMPPKLNDKRYSFPVYPIFRDSVMVAYEAHNLEDEFESRDRNQLMFFDK